MTSSSKNAPLSSDTVSLPKREDYMVAASAADWGQVVCNGGPPCFHLEGQKFCLRAQRWAGHDHPKEFHAFVPFNQLLDRLAADAAIEAIEDYENTHE
jgi:hypothetical protein